MQEKQIENHQRENNQWEVELKEQKEKYEQRMKSIHLEWQEAEFKVRSLQEEKEKLKNEISSLRLFSQSTEQLQDELKKSQEVFQTELQNMNKSKLEEIKLLQNDLHDAQKIIQEKEIQSKKLQKKIEELEKEKQSEVSLNQQVTKEQQDEWEASMHALRKELTDTQDLLRFETKLKFELEESKKEIQEELESLTGKLEALEDNLQSLKSSKMELEIQTKQQNELVETLRGENASLKKGFRGSVRMSVRHDKPIVIPTPPPVVPPVSAPPPPANLPPVTKSTKPAGLFDEIRGGKALKKVTKLEDDKDDISKHYDDQNVLHILAKALIARRQGVEGDKPTTKDSQGDDDWE